MRILLADEQSKVRFAIRVLLREHSEFMVVGEATDGQELIAQIALGNPDVTILDFHLPGLEDLGSIAILKKKFPSLYIIILSGRPELGQAALDAGADEFVSKIDPPEHLLSSLDRCQTYLDDKQSKITIH